MQQTMQETIKPRLESIFLFLLVAQMAVIMGQALMAPYLVVSIQPEYSYNKPVWRW
jgi:hypothetical protein